MCVSKSLFVLKGVLLASVSWMFNKVSVMFQLSGVWVVMSVSVSGRSLLQNVIVMIMNILH